MLDVQGCGTFSTCPQPEGTPFEVAAKMIAHRLREPHIQAMPDSTLVVLLDNNGEYRPPRCRKPRYRRVELGRFFLGDFRRLGHDVDEWSA
jgi:hypothetical protein